MDNILLVFVLLLNILISVWNCYAVGSAWKDVMTLGGTFDKVLMWSGVIQSGVGFSMPILLILSHLSASYLTLGEDPYITPEEGIQLLNWIYSLWYVLIIFPILGSGLAIWAHSLRVAYQRRDFSSIAVAGWNSFAQISNTLSAINNIGGALSEVGSLYKSLLSTKGDFKNKVAILAILIVITSIVLGFIIAFSLVKYFSNKSVSRIEEYSKELKA